jgi:hypothetical protein
MLPYNLKDHTAENAIAFLGVFIAAYTMTLFGEYDIEIGHYLYLPLGAKIIMYLLFGFTVLPGILFACVFSGIVLFNSWNDHLVLGTLAACAGVLAPIITMLLMRLLRVCNFSNLVNIDFRNVLLLIVLSSVISAVLKFFVYMQSVTLNLDTIDFITHYILGDVFGSLVVVYLVLKVLVPILAMMPRLQK